MNMITVFNEKYIFMDIAYWEIFGVNFAAFTDYHTVLKTLTKYIQKVL